MDKQKKVNATDTPKENEMSTSLESAQPRKPAAKPGKRGAKATQKKQRAAKQRLDTQKFERNINKIISKIDSQIATLTVLRQEYIRVHEMEDAVLASAIESCESLTDV